MKHIIKYEMGSWTSFVLKVVSAFIGAGAFLLLDLFGQQWSPVNAAFFGGFMAVVGHEMLVAIYVKFTKQYNSYGEWVTGGEGKPDEITPEEHKEKLEFRWYLAFLVALGLAFLFDLLNEFLVLLISGSVIVLVVGFVKKYTKK